MIRIEERGELMIAIDYQDRRPPVSYTHLMEFSVGRASQKSPVKAYNALEKKGQKWHIHGYLAMIGNYLLMMFYTTVAGWMIYYFYLTASGKFEGASAEQVKGAFGEMLGKPEVMILCMVAVVILGFFVNSIGLQNGLERITKGMMIALLPVSYTHLQTERNQGGCRYSPGTARRFRKPG